MVARIAKVSALSAALLIPAYPAAAYVEYSGFAPTDGMSTLETMLWFVGLPGGVFALVWLLWSLPHWLNENKHR